MRAVYKKEFEAVEKIKAAVLAHGNPFADEVTDENYVRQILEADNHGQKLY